MYTSQHSEYDYDKLNRAALEYDFLKIFKARKSLTENEFKLFKIKPCPWFKKLIKVEDLSNKQLMLFIESEDEFKRFRKNHKRINVNSRKKIKQSKKIKIPIKYVDRYNDYLKSDQWKMMRAGLIYIRGSKCENCGNTEKLEIHHLNYNNIFKEKMSDLKILCRDCHRKEHGL